MGSSRKTKTVFRLKTKIIVTLAFFSLLLSTIFCAFAIFSNIVSQDYVFDRIVSTITDHFLAHYRQYRALPSGLPQEIRAYLDLRQVDPETRQALRLETLPDGLYECNHHSDCRYPVDFHYTITTLPETGDRLYVLVDANEFEIKHGHGTLLVYQFIFPAVLTSLLGTFVGILLAKRVISTVGRLAERVRKARSELNVAGLSEGFANDEVGELAVTIESTMGRLAEFIERERQFTRNVSHELRTPLAVIKNGSELLRTSPRLQEIADLRPLERIERAVADMEKLVTTFLFLARETDISKRLVPCELSKRLLHLVEKYRYMLTATNNHPVIVGREVVVLAVPDIFDIIAGNLIRNAFQYAGIGPIEIRLQDDRITIVNNLSAEAMATSLVAPLTHGIGHTITSRLCDALGWQFDFTSHGDKAMAAVIFRTV